jgi:hypothetical protein
MATKTSSGVQLYSVLSRIWQDRQNTAITNILTQALGVEGSDEKELTNKITQLFKLIADTKEDAACLGEVRQFKSEVQQELMSETKVLHKGFDSQGIFWVCD